MSQAYFPPLPSAEARLMKTLGEAKGMLMDLRHFASNPDVPLQSNPSAYIRWNLQLGVHSNLAQSVLPIWCPPVDSEMLSQEQTSPSLESARMASETQPSPNQGVEKEPVNEFGWDPDDPETLKVIREAVEHQQRFPVQVCSSVDLDLHTLIRRHKGGVTGFINEALEAYLADPVCVLGAAGLLAERRRRSSSRIAVSGRIPLDLSHRITTIQESLATKVARVTVSKIVGGCVLLLAEAQGMLPFRAAHD